MENGLNTPQYLINNSVFLDEKLAFALSHSLMESVMESAVMEAVKKLKARKNNFTYKIIAFRFKIEKQDKINCQTKSIQLL